MGRTKSGCSSRRWLFILVVLSYASLSSCQSDEEESDTEPIKTALKPMYEMVKGFIKVIQPNDLDEIEDVVTKWTDKIDKGELSWEDILKEKEFYEDIVWYMIGFVICLAIGIVLIITMIFTGFIMCCCRCCCGKCGGQVEPQEGKNSKSARICCGILLFVFTTILLAGCLVLFMSNELIQEQTSKEPQAIIPQVNKAIDGVDKYKNTLVQELKSNVVGGLATGLAAVVNTLANAPQTALVELNKKFESTDIINSATALLDSVDLMNKSMVEIQDYTGQLKTNAETLDEELTAVKGRISNTLNNCPANLASDCLTTRTTVDGIAIQPDFDSMYDISNQLRNVQNLLSASPSLPELINRGVTELERISTEVAGQTGEVVGDVSNEVDFVNGVVDLAVGDFEEKIRDDFNLNFTHKTINKYQDEVEEYGTYRWYAGIAIGCMFLLIVVFYYFGLIFGCTGEPPYEDGASTCNRGVGANLFMAGVVFTFLFFWLMMIILIVLFVIGGPMYSELCRNLIHIETSPVLDEMNEILQQILDEQVNLDYEVNLATILKQCKENGPLYQAFSLDQLVNLTDVLDLDKYNIDKELDKIQEISVDLPNIDILDDEAEQKLLELSSAQLDNIGYQSYYTQLEKIPVEPRLSTVATSLETLANEASGTSFANSMRDHATELRNLDSNLVSQLEQTMPKLKASIQTLQGEIEGSHGSSNSFAGGVNDLINDMKDVENDINAGGDTLVRDLLDGMANSLYADAKTIVAEISRKLQHEFGRCQPLYGALDIAITAGCESFLDPWNSFWFAMGWCLITLIPCMIVALVLVSEYRKTDDYEPADNKSFDDPNFDAYAGSYPGDNIPLEDVERRKNPGGGRGQPNTAYQSDAMQNSNYHRDNYYHRNGGPSYGHGGYGAGGGYPASPGSVTGYRPSNAYPTSGTTPPNPPHYYNNRNQRMY